MTGRFLQFCLAIFSLIPLCSSAQNYSNYTWFFCNQSVEFNRTNKEPNLSTHGVALTGPVAVAADPATGDILFYTDGVNVYDASNQLMVNGTGLQGNPAGNQPVVLGQVPGQPNQYYIITNSPTGSITYSIVDMAAQGNAGAIPLGEVVNASKNTAIGSLTNQSPAMITIAHENGTDFFIITHTRGTNTYNVTLITSAGVASVTAFSGTGLIENAANFVYNPTTDQIAVAPGEANRNVEILNFDPASGTLVAEATLPLTATNSPNGVYDMEWSPDGAYLYVSTSGANGQPDLIQYDLENLNPVNGLITPVSVLPQPNTITGSYGIQPGPDGNIYHLYESGGQIRMGVINEPDSAAVLVEYDAQAFSGTFCTTQFTTGLPAQPVTIDIDIEGSGCVNVPTQLFPNVTPAADSLQWFITGEAEPFSSAWSPVHTFEQGGPVSITVVAYLGGEPTSYEETINIIEFDTQITLEPEVTGCTDEFTDPIVRPPGWVPCGTGGGSACLTVEAQIQGTQGTIRWFGPEGEIAGANTTTLTPKSPGYYYMVVGDGPCFAYAGVNVKEYDVPDPRANVWFFGNRVGLDFNPIFRDPPEEIKIITSPMEAPEGTATMSDRNGQAILYTDGETVWNRNGDVVATDIGGSNTATQSSLIMGVPGDETLYYIFTTQEIDDGTFELRYTLFDLKLNGGTGGIVDPDNDPATLPPSTVLFTRSTERLLAVGDFIIAHEYGTNTFRAYRLTPQGIEAPVISNIGSDHTVTSPESGEGYMAFSAGRIAVALNGSIEIFDYDVATGELTNFRSVTAPGPVYGVAFSSSGEKMYATVLGNPGEIIEYYYDEDADAYVQMPTTIVMTGSEGAQPGAMQYGPDGQLYVAIEGETTLGAILPQDDDDTQSGFQPDATPDLGGVVNLGLPNFVQQIANPIQEPGVTVPLVCTNTEVEFTATGKDNTIDEFSWEFFDPSGTPITVNPSDSSTVALTFTVAGTYRYRVKIWNKCEGSEQAPYFLEDEEFEVNDIPPPPPMLAGEPGVICDDTGVTLIAADPQVPGTTYLWNTGSDQRTIQVTTPGRYSVTVTSPAGCVNTGETLIAPYFGNVTLGPDVDICEDAPYEIEIAAVFPNATWTWFENGVQQPTPNVENVFPVDTSTPGAKTIRLELSDNICSISDEVIVNVNPVPVFTAPVQPDTDCDPAVNNGEITLTIAAPPSRPLGYSIAGDGGFSQSGSDIVAPDAIPVTGLGAGVYNITVADQVSGCANTQVVNIDNNDFTFTAEPTPSGLCHPTMSIDVAGVSSAGTYTYQIFNPSGALVRDGSGTAPNFTTVTLPPQDGSYTIRLSNPGGCQVSEIVDIQQGPEYDVFIDNSLVCSDNQVQLAYGSGPNDAVPSWTATAPDGTGNGIISFSGNTATLAVGTWVVTMVAEGASACPATATRIVTVSPPLTADFTQSDACVDPVVLTSTPIGSQYVYRWSRNGGAPFSATPNVSLNPADDGNSFMVTVINSQSGCTDDSENRVVRVIEPFTVSIAVPPFACDGTEFQVVASASRPDVTQYQWFLNGGALAQTGAVLNATQGGTYRVIGSLQGCLSPPAERSITPNPAPQVALGPMQRICPYPGPAPTRTAIIDAGPGFASYDWFRVEGNAVIPLNATSQQYTADTGGVYRVEVTDADGCPNTADVEIVQECDPIISAPNAFRPGSSVSPNESFAVVTQFITDEDFQVFIFNRWGEMVYESTDRTFKWNGAYKGSGQLLPAGTYAYVVKYKSEYHPEDGIQEARGGVVLVR